MKIEQFIQHLQPLPPMVSANEAKAMEQFIEQYPWCGIAQQLFLEALQQNNAERFADYIPKAAMYVVHRERLCHRLQQLKTQPAPQVEDILIIEEETLVTCNSSLVTQEEEPLTHHSSFVTQEEETPVTKKPLFISAPSDYFAGETIEIAAETDPITRFIVERPRITPIAGPLIGIELPNQIEQAPPPKNFEDIVTETLARVYEDQGLVSLAQNAYEKLCLLKPKKSAYFAARIQNLKFKLKS